jgi:hypothetical protein
MILLASHASLAAEFHGVELGSSCADINQVEDELGSSPIPVRSRGGGEYRFSGHAYGRQIEIVYLCKNGTLAIGSYLFRSEEFDAAAEFFRSTYDALRARLGTPHLEHSWDANWGEKTEFPRPGVEPPKGYSASWQGPDFRAHLDLKGKEHWSVVFGIFYTRSN